MPRRTFTRLRGLVNNRRRLLDFVGYNSIRTFRRENAGYNTNDRAYRAILGLYNEQVDLLENQERQRQRVIQQQQRNTRTLTTGIMRQVRNQLRTPSQAEQSVNVDYNALQDINPLLNRLMPTLQSNNRKMYMKAGQRIYMLNARTIPRLEQILSPQYVIEEPDSATELLTAIIETGDFDLVLLPEGNQQVEGGLFPYNHTLDKVDLKRYAIFHKDTEWGDERNDHNCLITALKSAGIDTGGVEEFVKNQFIPQKYLNKIAGIIKRYIIVKPLYTDKGKNCLRKYGDEKDEPLHIGLIKSHYFIIEETNYTAYAIRNYFDIHHLEKWNEIKEKHGKGYKYNGNKIDSHKLIALLLEKEPTHLKTFEGLEIYKMNNYKKYEEDIYTSLEFDNSLHYYEFDKKLGELIEHNENGCLEKNEPKVASKKRKVLGIDYFDFETSTKRKDGIQVNHKPYLCCSSELNGGFIGENCGRELLDYYTDKYGIPIEDYPDPNDCRPVFIIIAHNSGYDFRFIMEHFHTITSIEKGTGLMVATCEYYYNKKNRITKQNTCKKLCFEIRDSLKMINMPLCKFGKTFGLKIQKEILPYDLYTEENIEKKYIDVKECLEFISEKDEKEYLQNVKKWDCFYDGNKKINIIKYSYEYCRMDCNVLKAGYEKFRELCDIAIGLDILEHISLASIANEYLVQAGCYDDVLKIAGIPRAFIQKCIVGGRTMTAENKKYNIQDKQLADFDAVSLYPSGMARMKGFLRGEPKIIRKFEPEKYDGYFICIRITKIGKHLKFPLASYVNEKGVRMFSNELEGRILYIDRVGLEDLINYQQVEYDFINGYYYDEGHNNKIKETIQLLFRERLKYKAVGNPLQLVFKECMNSSYGKSYLKPIDSDNKYVRNDEWVWFVNRHFNMIKQATPLANGKGYKVNLLKPVNRHFNNAQVGVEILSITKRIMNEVMVLAEDLKLDIYYQDTDSIHIQDKDIEILEKEYNTKYSRELIGKQMGQFHTDFDLKGSVGDIVATKSIFLGKKAYIDKLKGKDKDGNVIYDYHIRMKGVPENSIRYKADTEYDGDVFQIYQDLYDGKEITFDLLAVKPKFDLKRDMTISSKKTFNRRVKF